MNVLKTIYSALVFVLVIAMATDAIAQSNRRPQGSSTSGGYSPSGSAGRPKYSPPSGSGSSAGRSGYAPRGSGYAPRGSGTASGGSGSTQGTDSSTRSSGSGSANRNEPEEELPPLSAEAQAAMDQFELTRNQLMTNKRAIDKLYRTVPIGFVDKQLQHMNQIKALEKQNKALEDRIIGEAVALFRLAPSRNRFAANLVVGQAVEALDPKSPASRFNPKRALEIFALLLKGDEEPPWEVLIRTFRASYAVQDFERCRTILDRLEQIGTLKPVYYELLEKTNQKWQDELLVRRLETQTGDLPVAVFKTSEGEFRVVLFENEAPATVNNFVALVEEGFYNGRAFYQVKPGEYAATGSPNDDGSGSIGYAVKGEAAREKARSHFAGTLTMSPNNDNTGNTGSVFLICHQPKTELDGQFTAFGRIESDKGLDVAHKLKTHDATQFRSVRTKPSTIISVTIENKRAHRYVKTPVESTVSSGLETTDDLPDGDTEDDPSSFDLLQGNN